MPSKPKKSTYEEKAYINNVLQEYKDKNFVQRVMYPEQYPKLDLGNGYHATHKMSWGEHPDNPGLSIVYPNVIM
jgi:hypothetical protein